MTETIQGGLPGLDYQPIHRLGVREEVMLLVTDYHRVGLVQMLEGHWLPPQGGIEPKETVQKAAFRELMSEAGIPPQAVTGAIVLMQCDHQLPPERVEQKQLTYHTKSFVGVCLTVSAVKQLGPITDPHVRQFKAAGNPFELMALMNPHRAKKAVRMEKYHLCCGLMRNAMQHGLLDSEYRKAFTEAVAA